MIFKTCKNDVDYAVKGLFIGHVPSLIQATMLHPAGRIVHSLQYRSSRAKFAPVHDVTFMQIWVKSGVLCNMSNLQYRIKAKCVTAGETQQNELCIHSQRLKPQQQLTCSYGMLPSRMMMVTAGRLQMR